MSETAYQAEVQELESRLSEPTGALIESLARLEGDLIVLGVAGKMGPTLSWMARRALDQAGQKDRKVYGAARFSNPLWVDWLRERGIEPISCDLLDPEAVSRLPDAPLVVSMAAMKFGATGQEAATWAINAWLGGNIARRFASSRMVVFSTGNVYPLWPATSKGPAESDPLGPIGEYAMSCVGRERIFEYFSRVQRTRMAFIRLNYAVEPRYGVLHDLSRRILAGEPISLSMGHFNVIWQADANDCALRSLELAEVPPRPVNVTGPERLAVREVATELGRLLGREPIFQGAEAPDALLSNSSMAIERFGPPRLLAEDVIPLVADWAKRGLPTLGKPTKFEVRDGRF